MNEQMERVTAREAAKQLNMDIVTLEFLMRNNRLPIGYAVKREGKKRYNYVIYKGLLEAHKRYLAGMGKADS